MEVKKLTSFVLQLFEVILTFLVVPFALVILMICISMLYESLGFDKAIYFLINLFIGTIYIIINRAIKNRTLLLNFFMAMKTILIICSIGLHSLSPLITINGLEYWKYAFTILALVMQFLQGKIPPNYKSPFETKSFKQCFHNRWNKYLD